MTGQEDFGSKLQAAREAKELTRTDVADLLKLPVRIIDQLEQQEIDKLPVAAFTVGYLRAYAKQLDLDGDELVKSYRSLYPQSNEQSALVSRAVASAEYPPMGGQFRDGKLAQIIHSNPGGVISAAVIAAVIVASLVIWLVWPDGAPEGEKSGIPAAVLSSQINAESHAAEESVIGSATEPSIDVPVESSTATRIETQEIFEADSAPDELPIKTDAVAITTAKPSAQALTEDESKRAEVSPAVLPSNDGVQGRRITPTGDDRLDLTFQEDCWVEVKDASGRNLYSDLNRANTTLNLVGQSPFRVVLGYAPGVELYFNGEAIALAPHTRNNVASIMLGQ